MPNRSLLDGDGDDHGKGLPSPCVYLAAVLHDDLGNDKKMVLETYNAKGPKKEGLRLRLRLTGGKRDGVCLLQSRRATACRQVSLPKALAPDLKLAA